MTLILANLAAFQLGWLACVLGAAKGLSWIGPPAVAMLLGLQLLFLPNPVRFGRFLVLAGVLGFALDTTLGSAGILRFHEPGLPGWLCPPWLAALWMMFASTLPLSLDWLSGWPRFAALCGTIGGPLSYYAGASLGALDLPGEPRTSLLILAAVWGILLPGLYRLKARMGLAPPSLS